MVWQPPRKRSGEILWGFESSCLRQTKRMGMKNVYGLRHRMLLKKIKTRLPELKELLKKVNGPWYYEDSIYRFYHQSFKVYSIQDMTLTIVKALKDAAPKGSVFNGYFEIIFKEGTGKKFKHRHNDAWLRHTRPQLEAFFHARYFLEMAVKYGRELKEAPRVLPSGWAGLLYYYGLR